MIIRKKIILIVNFLLLISNGNILAESRLQQVEATIEEVSVWGELQDSRATGYTSPTSVLTQEDLLSVNITTTEDIVKYEPSIVIRRRFIGDSNGTLGLRGSNMFQTARSMVFADGVPLHYLLQSRWNGAPRWTMVSASEIARVEIIYGPFSAQYSGNAMGGVVLIETAIPQQQTFHIDGAFFTQQFDDYGFDDTVNGYKGFVSYGNKTGNLSYYLSYNHLDNDSHPQSFRDTGFVYVPDNVSSTVHGVIDKRDSRGQARLWYGDSGVVNTITDNYKFKLGYDIADWSALLNIAYEDRDTRTHSPNTYVTDSLGKKLWSGTDLVSNGKQFSFGSHRLNINNLQRKSLSLGGRLKGYLSEDTHVEFSINHFDILTDENRASAKNPSDPTYVAIGQIKDYNNSGWKAAQIILTNNRLGIQGLQLITGISYEAYQLNLDVYRSTNYMAGVKDQFSSRFGGKTTVSALFTQSNWDINYQWGLSLGLRYEHFNSKDGYFDKDDPITSELDLEYIPRQSKHTLSPKFSIAYQPSSLWQVRYSLAKAYRFPIVEELFSQYRAYNTVALSNPELEAEDGLHHNLMLDRTISNGYLRVNFFQETIKNVIESQTDLSTQVRTFVPIDKVKTQGIEFIVNKQNLLSSAVDIRFNMAYTDANIIENIASPSIEGNYFPRMPMWRGNFLITYHIVSRWNVGGSLQYTSDSYGRLDNNDIENNVFGAQDAYTRIGLKTNYAITDNSHFSVGIDNITNETAYVAHPWPGRTMYINFSYDL